MRVGSLVVILPCKIVSRFVHLVRWFPICDESTIYTIREIVGCPKTKQQVVRLEEGVIGRCPSGDEFGIWIGHVKEVQPPMDISELIEESIYVPVEKVFAALQEVVLVNFLEEYSNDRNFIGED